MALTSTPPAATPMRFGNRFMNKMNRYESLYGPSATTRNRGQGFNRQFINKLGAFRAQNPRLPQEQAPAPQPTVTPTVQPDVKTMPGEDVARTLFPSVRSFEPKNYEGSPLYQFQRDQGLGALDKTLAARGLTNSGAELELKQKFLTDLGAREAEVARGYAQNEADRYWDMQRTEADRLERRGDRQFDNSFNLAQLALSQNPMQQAYSATNSLADALRQWGSRRGQLKGSQIPRGGGGGGTPFSPDLSQFGPDLSSYYAAKAQEQQGQSQSWANTLSNVIGSLFK